MPPTVQANPIAEETFDNVNGRTRGFVLTEQGLEAWRWFRVRHDDPAVVSSAAGLPAQGSAWPDPTPGFAGLVCVSWSPQIISRTTFVQCLYRSRDRASPDAVAQLNDAFHDVQQNQSSIEVVRDIENNEIPASQIESPSGNQELTITAYKDSITFRGVWRGLIGRLNENQVAIPPMRGLPGTGYIAPPKTLLARPLTYEVVRNGLIRVTFRMGEAPDWKLRYVPIGPDGQPVAGPPLEREMYPAVPWDVASLWGTI